MADQLQVEPTPPGALARFLVPNGSTGAPAVTAFLAGLAGTAAFIGSLILDWQRVRIEDYQEIFNGGGPPAQLDMQLGVDASGMANFTLVYLFGALGLITLLGMVLTRPDHALRLRMGAAGLGLGLVGVLVAMLAGMKDTIFGLSSLGIFTGLDQAAIQGVLDEATISYEPGFFCAIATVVLLPVGVFLAAGRPSRAAAFGAQVQLAAIAAAHQVAPAAQPYGSPHAPAGPVPAQANGTTSTAAPAGVTAAPPPGPIRPGYVGELTVTASDSIDPGAETDVWRR